MPVDSTILRPDSTAVYALIYLTRADTYHTDARLTSDLSDVVSDKHILSVDRTIVSEAPVGLQRRMPRYRIL